MDNPAASIEQPAEEHVPFRGRSTKRRARSIERSGESKAANRMSSLSIQCPSDVVAVFEAAAVSAGINRQHLFREALETYAALLASGHRTFRQPGMSGRKVA
jgi:hypothetical protein